MKKLTELCAEGRTLIGEGAMGTMLSAAGLAGKCPEAGCLDAPEKVKAIAEAYIEAGSLLVTTNTFGGTTIKLGECGPEYAEKADEINTAAVKLAKEAAGGKALVGGDIGSTGHLAKEEYGDIPQDDMYAAFSRQAKTLALAGADYIIIETMTSIMEAQAAIKAAKETGLPVICTFAFDLNKKGQFRTFMGVGPETAAEISLEAGADIVGANCGKDTTIEHMAEIARIIRELTDKPILINSNAGAPILKDGAITYIETPEKMAESVPALIEAGANIIGGCCGTTPAHIKAMAKAAEAFWAGR
ncbi:MAG: homocysteine S-methyltransferase family protein [Abditibacteriota bacterium]|nr:homocysteine S-methyltransferase family protein [Abditibacteriota bacterium]